jgi:hypothetical protein
MVWLSLDLMALKRFSESLSNPVKLERKAS